MSYLPSGYQIFIRNEDSDVSNMGNLVKPSISVIPSFTPEVQIPTPPSTIEVPEVPEVPEPVFVTEKQSKISWLLVGGIVVLSFYLRGKKKLV